jgi:polar amino acid transport system permease protein
MDFFLEMAPPLLEGLRVTLELWLLSGVLGLVFALGVAIARVSSLRAVRSAATLFISVIRGTPLLVQIYILYYGVGNLFAQYPAIRHSVIWPFLRDGFWYAAAALIVNMAAYGGEILRGAIIAVPRGEIEAGRSLGLRPWMVWRLLILPRALRFCLPALVGQLINLLKSTALASTITVMDLLGTANYIRMQSFRIYEPLFAVAVVYTLLSLLLLRCAAFLEAPQRPRQ